MSENSEGDLKAAYNIIQVLAVPAALESVFPYSINAFGATSEGVAAIFREFKEQFGDMGYDE